ncbi:hypothetical protein ACTQZK_00885 [Paraeggerthella sp. LCP19S3_G8]|uniref:hypothetical protein n=1 Tax=Paraeggerthella sp. LCP19S3_G8 TaxID=3440248 RepID=UPI002A8AD1CC|nr:hypothetical protein [Paraeggerthella sp.]
MKIMGMGFPEFLAMLPLFTLVLAAYAIYAFVRSRKAASLPLSDGSVQDSDKEKYMRRAIVAALFVGGFVVLMNMHFCDNCGNWFFGKVYSSYYSRTLCLDCARSMVPGILS